MKRNDVKVALYQAEFAIAKVGEARAVLRTAGDAVYSLSGKRPIDMDKGELAIRMISNDMDELFSKISLAKLVRDRDRLQKLLNSGKLEFEG